MSKGPLINEAIRATEVLVFDEDGADLGIMTRAAALAMARHRGRDLVQVDIASSPPPCRLIDARAHKETLDRQARAERLVDAPPKELRLRTATGAHDVATQTRKAAQLLAAGHQVKISVALEKSQRANPAAARTLLDGIVRDLGPVASVARKPFSEKGMLSVLLSPSA